MMQKAPRVQNGTFTSVSVDGIEVAGLTGFTAKVTKQKADIQFCGQMAIDSKTTGTKGTGSLDFYQIYTMFPEDMAALSAGTDARHTIVGVLADPDAFGAERIAFYDCSFDEHTLFNAQAGQPGKNTMPFTFVSWDFLDKVEVT